MRTIKSKNLMYVLLSCLMLFTLSSTAFASYKQWPLQSNGEVRYMKMIKVYDIGLYSPTKVTSENILNPNISKCLKIDYAVSLSVDKFRLATSKVLQRQHSKAFLNSIKGPLEMLQNAYKPVKKGDFYSLCYNAKNKIMSLGLNEKILVEIKSVELAKAYLGIWLSSNKPISGPLYRSFFNKKI